MGKGVRYKIEHMGDSIADGLEQTLGWAKSSTRGVSLTYNIHELEKKKKEGHEQNRGKAVVGKGSFSRA